MSVPTQKPWYVRAKTYTAWRDRINEAIVEQKTHEDEHPVPYHPDVRERAVLQRIHRQRVVRDRKRVRRNGDGEAKWPAWVRALALELIERAWTPEPEAKA